MNELIKLRKKIKYYNNKLKSYKYIDIQNREYYLEQIYFTNKRINYIIIFFI